MTDKIKPITIQRRYWIGKPPRISGVSWEVISTELKHCHINLFIIDGDSQVCIHPRGSTRKDLEDYITKLNRLKYEIESHLLVISNLGGSEDHLIRTWLNDGSDNISYTSSVVRGKQRKSVFIEISSCHVKLRFVGTRGISKDLRTILKAVYECTSLVETLVDLGRYVDNKKEVK